MFIVDFYRKVNCCNILNRVPTKELYERSCKAFAHVISHFDLTHLHQQFKMTNFVDAAFENCCNTIHIFS